MAARVHDARETAALLDFASLVAALERAAREYADGAIDCPDRLVTALPDAGTMLSMPATAVDVAIHKLITVCPGNGARGLPTLQGQLTVFDPHTGTVSMVLDGPTVTGRRSAAISMLALRLLAPVRQGTVLLFGTGSQAGHHVDALAALHPQWRVRVAGTSGGSVQRFCDAHGHPDLAPASSHESPDVVITCTTSRTPVWRDAARPETLVVAMGSFDPRIAEVASSTVAASDCYIDDPRSGAHEAGDLLLAGVAWHAVTPLIDLLQASTLRPDRPAFFKSVGCAAWDLAAARVALAAAR